MDVDEVLGWDGLSRRGDAMSVAQTLDGSWIIRPPDGRPVITMCPCCDEPFLNARAAKLVADALYPAP